MLIRVAEQGTPAFRLRKGEEGLSIFDTESVDPPLTEAEILDSFRTGSVAVARSIEEVKGFGLEVVPIEGAASLPDRLRRAHVEIRPGRQMSRTQFKQSLKELEDGT
ncbi:MAG: hypothetical protein WD069_13435 [Planctomycetales bacterium]